PAMGRRPILGYFLPCICNFCNRTNTIGRSAQRSYSQGPLCNGEAGKYCGLCGAWFNNPLMARQHYEGKKHKRNAARARLLEQLAEKKLMLPTGNGSPMNSIWT
uniref:Matrin-type domain-containing protein n=1 Tax=Paramormyrops kingsleyae TaxID=1676925 RepID=A0A3B3T5U0_9TELE